MTAVIVEDIKPSQVFFVFSTGGVDSHHTSPSGFRTPAVSCLPGGARGSASARFARQGGGGAGGWVLGGRQVMPDFVGRSTASEDPFSGGEVIHAKDLYLILPEGEEGVPLFHGSRDV